VTTSFPTQYPDELLYSVIARYHVRSGNTSPKATIEDLFDSRTAAAVVDMPCYINALYWNLPEVKKIEPESLIMQHTLFPYYTAFLQQSRVNFVISAMKSNYGGDIHTSTGIMASNISVPEFLRFCPKCNMYDISTRGECYWHRIHQVPGVLVCPIHNEILQDSTIAVHGMNKHEFFAANEHNCISKLRLISCNEEIDKLYTLANDIVWLIENYKTVRNSKELENGFRDRYLAILMDKGLATSKGRVYQNEFIEGFRTFYGDAFLSTIQCAVVDGFEDNWLSSIVRKHRKVFHPLRHLLLIRYLTGNIEDFFKSDYKYSPFGYGPWPCMNAATEHYNLMVVNNLKVTHSSDTKQPIGTFTCSCGFIYSRTGPDKCEDDIYKIGRIKQFGGVWENKLKELVDKDNLGLRETARRLKVDANTVDRYVKLMGLNAVWLLNKSNTAVNAKNVTINHLNVDLENYRERWQKLKYEHSEASKTQLRELNKATYTWLYRHDRDWLNQNSPSGVSNTSQNKRIDWTSRDKKVLEKVKETVGEILGSNSKPERITIGRIGRKTGLLALLEKHLNKMPKTKVYLEKTVESSDQYAIRRIRWCASQLRKKGEEIKEWKLVRMAGLRQGYSEKIQQALDNEVQYRNSYTKIIDEIN